MRLTLYTDYSLRVLMFLSYRRSALGNTLGSEWVSTEEMSSFYGISKNHLVKVVNHLGHLKFVVIKRGRSGGVKLARDPSQINLADVVQASEPDFYLTECFDVKTNVCVITPSCALKTVLKRAHQSFIQTLGTATLADVTTKSKSHHLGKRAQ